LDSDIVAQKFKQITLEINSQSHQTLSPEDVALGFLKVANESMTRPIRNATEARGFVPDKHNLVSFGGAGGQHACAIASNLGIKRILIHKYSSILSAYGIALADLQSEASMPYSGNFEKRALPNIHQKIEQLKTKVKDSLFSQGVAESSMAFETTLSMRYKGSDTNISIWKPDDDDYGAAFIATHFREFAFSLNRDVVVDAIKVRGIGSSGTGPKKSSPFRELGEVRESCTRLPTSAKQEVYLQGSWESVPVQLLQNVGKGSIIEVRSLISFKPSFD
jgi:5-oxoprolinase (ATP-hydrolysing)